MKKGLGIWRVYHCDL